MQRGENEMHADNFVFVFVFGVMDGMEPSKLCFLGVNDPSPLKLLK